MLIVVFLIGVLLGRGMDLWRVSDVSENLGNWELDTESFVVEQSFIDNFGGENCELIESRMRSLSRDLGLLGTTLEDYNRKKLFFNQDRFDDIKRKYFLLELRTYSLRKKMHEKCKDSGEIILFFYDTKDNEESLKQGYVLDSLVKELNNVTVFSLDIDFDEKEPLIKTIKNYYGIQNAPTIIINFDEKKDVFTNKAEIKQILGKL